MTKPTLENSYQNPEKDDEPFGPNLRSYVPKENFPLGIKYANLDDAGKEKILIDLFSKLESRSSDRMKLALAVLQEDEEMAKTLFNANYGAVVKKEYDFLVILLVLFVSALTDLITENKSPSKDSEMVYTGIASSLIVLVSQIDHWCKKNVNKKLSDWKSWSDWDNWSFIATDTLIGVLFASERLFKVSVAAWKQSNNISLPDWITPLFIMLMMFMSKQYVSELTVLTLFVNCAFTCVLISKKYGIIFILGAWALKRYDKQDFDRNFRKHAQNLKFLLFALIGLIFAIYLVKSNQKLFA